MAGSGRAWPREPPRQTKRRQFNQNSFVCICPIKKPRICLSSPPTCISAFSQGASGQFCLHNRATVFKASHNLFKSRGRLNGAEGPHMRIEYHWAGRRRAFWIVFCKINCLTNNLSPIYFFRSNQKHNKANLVKVYFMTMLNSMRSKQDRNKSWLWCWCL